MRADAWPAPAILRATRSPIDIGAPDRRDRRPLEANRPESAASSPWHRLRADAGAGEAAAARPGSGRVPDDTHLQLPAAGRPALRYRLSRGLLSRWAATRSPVASVT